MKKISIIIPLYNAASSIVRCLSSIMETEYDKYEIIVIDDGSTDNSVDLVKELMNKNSHILLVSQENKGPSVARNKGLEIAKGDIITFVDSDDYVSSSYIQRLVEAFEESEADVIFFPFNRVTEEGIILSEHTLPILKNDYFINLIALSEKDMFGYTWVKAFRREVIGKIRFDDNLDLLEDEVFTCKVLQNKIKLFYLDEPLYYYVRTNETLANKTHQDYSRICDYVWKEWRNLLKDTELQKQVLCNKANHIAQNCKYYALERSIKKFEFYRDIANSDYIKMSTLEDTFIDKIKKRKWIEVLIYHFSYKSKVYISKLIRKI